MNSYFMKWLLLFLVVVAGCGLSSSEDYSIATITITNSDSQQFVFTAEVPLSAYGFELGLMHREHLDLDKGMLFAYPDSNQRTFWMKNTLIPLDIMFIDENFVIQKIHNAVPCVTEPCELYASEVPVKYVFEINGNLAAENNINIGDFVQIRGLNDKR